MALEPQSVRSFAIALNVVNDAYKTLCIDLITAGQMGHVKTFTERMLALEAEFRTHRSNYSAAILAKRPELSPVKTVNVRTVKGPHEQEPKAKKPKSPKKAES